MSRIPNRVRAAVAVSAVGAGLLVLPATASADDPAPDAGVGGATTTTDAGAGTGSGGSGGSEAGTGAAVREPETIVSATGGAIVRAGNQLLESMQAAVQQATTPAVPKVAGAGTAAAGAVPVEPAPVVAVAPDVAAEPAPIALAAAAPAAPVAADAAPAAATAPEDPISDFFSRFTTTTHRNCGCGWVEDDDEDTPPDNPPPDNPPPDQYGWGIPVGVPPVPGNGKKYKYVPCGAAVTLPPVSTTPTATTVVVRLPEVPGFVLPPAGGGGGAAPLALMGGGAPLGGGSAGSFAPASYTGLTFLTGAYEPGRASNAAAGGVLASIFLSVGGVLLFWRRHAHRQGGRHRVGPARRGLGGMWR